ncbi:MAG: sigma-70 family RNA polymerase sigma factor [Leptolyngbya sp.]|nr:sigma-70 family RNA polymerase sigma factor [Candidatus Melainabacteria bacterium]
MDHTDESIVEQFRQTKDATQFKSLVRRYQNRIYNAAFRILGSKDEAEEVTQDTFLRVHQGLDRFREQASFSSWIFRITHNLCVDLVRAKQRKAGLKVVSFDPQSTQSEDELYDSANSVSQIADPMLSPAQLVDEVEQQEVIQKYLMELPENQRTAIVLHDIEGFQYQEIAEILGTSVGTVRSRIYYGRMKLRELLTPYFASQGVQTASR